LAKPQKPVSLIGVDDEANRRPQTSMGGSDEASNSAWERRQGISENRSAHLDRRPVRPPSGNDLGPAGI
jgi:hypothetical protein